MASKALIIGSGYSGLAAAALLAQQGWEVEVCEKNPGCGGRAQIFRDSGFLFDMGPSWYLMPEAFERLFGLLGTTPQECFELKRLKPSYRIYTGDGSLDIQPDLADNAEAFDRLEPGGYGKVVEYLRRAEEQYTLSVDHFLYRPYPNLRSMLHPTILSRGLKLGLLSLCKRSAFLLAQLAGIMTLGRCCLAPSIIVTAVKR